MIWGQSVLDSHGDSYLFQSKIDDLEIRLQCLKEKRENCLTPKVEWLDERATVEDEIEQLESLYKYWNIMGFIKRHIEQKEEYETFTKISEQAKVGWKLVFGTLSVSFVLMFWGFVKWRARQKSEDRLLFLRLKIKEYELKNMKVRGYQRYQAKNK